MKRLIAVVGTFVSVCVLCMSGYAQSLTHVASHATPALVDEINDVFAEVESGAFSMAGVLVTNAGSISYVTVIGGETNDAVIKLFADQADDAADKWYIESETADNDLVFVNNTTESFKVTAAGAGTFASTISAVAGACVTQVISDATSGFTNIYNSSGLLISHNP